MHVVVPPLPTQVVEQEEPDVVGQTWELAHRRVSSTSWGFCQGRQ